MWVRNFVNLDYSLNKNIPIRFWRKLLEEKPPKPGTVSISVGDYSELLMPLANHIVLGGLLADEIEAWEAKHGSRSFEVGVAVNLGVVPAIVKSNHGFVILFPYGFFQFFETFQAEVEEITRGRE